MITINKEPYDKMKDYLDRHFADPQINILDVSMACGLAHSYYSSRVFKRIFGFTPWTYIMNKRMEKALELLRRGACSRLEEVSDECGYWDVRTFNFAWKRHFKKPPMTYIKEMEGVS